MPGKRARRPPREPSEVFALKFRAAVLQFSADFLKTDGFKHALTKGEERELPVQQFLRANLPETFGVERGEVVDPYGSHGPQLDVIVFDRLRNIPVHAGGSALVPAEALLASVEVKTELTKAVLVESFRAAARLTALRPFKRPLLRGNRGNRAPRDACRYFHVLFGYRTDLTESNWIDREYSRLADAAREAGTELGVIDRVYVAQRGLIQPGAARAVAEASQPGLGLMNLYMHLLSFVLRENRNRKEAPYEQYAGRMTEGWRQLS